MKVGTVVVTRRMEDVSLELRNLPNCIIVDGPKSLAEKRNLGASRFDSTADFIAFVDDDNRLASDSLEEMVKGFVDENVGAVSPLIFDSGNSIWFAGMHWTPFGISVIEKKMMISEAFLPTQGFHDVFMVRRRVFEEVGGFDCKRFPFYLGEADLAERMKKRGYKFVVAPKAKVWHDIPGNASILRRSHIENKMRAYMVGRNRLLFLRMHKPLSNFLIYVFFILPFLATLHIIGMVNEKKLGFVKSYLRGIKDGL